VPRRAEPWIRDLVSELGFLHDSNSLDDELPYWDRAARPKPVLVLPYGFDTNDMKFFSPNGFTTAADFSRYVSTALDVLVAEARRGKSSMLTIGLHLRICGQPGRFAGHRKYSLQDGAVSRASLGGAAQRHRGVFHSHRWFGRVKSYTRISLVPPLMQSPSQQSRPRGPCFDWSGPCDNQRWRSAQT
jgi:hypothetical protein